MAAIVSPWSKPGAWALDSEENEADLLQQPPPQPAAAAVAEDFPSLSAAAASKPKKKKGQTFSLAEFTTSSAAAPSKPAGLTREDLLVLPTGPRERSAEEVDRNRLGGGFRSYGSGRYGDESDSRRGGFDDSRRREPLPPSRADETDDWGAGKKSMIGNGFERRERSGGLFGSQSKADEVDNWGSNKNSEVSRFGNGGGSDFGRERRGFRGGYEGLGNGSGADSDRWGRKKEDDSFTNGLRPDSDRWGRMRDDGGFGDGSRAELERWGRRREDEGSMGASSARPKLVLQPRTLPVVSEPVGGLDAVKPKGANPFGSARPREEVLKEKGQDWKEIDEKLESMRVKEAERGEKSEGFGRRSLGSGNLRAGSQEDKTERSWRKNETVSIDTAADDSPSGEEEENNTEEDEA